MQQYSVRLLALLTILLLMPLPLLAMEADGNLLELGVGNVSISDENGRVNEYSTVAPEDETVLTGKLKVSGDDNGLVYDIEGKLSGGDDVEGAVKIDVQRVLRFSSSYQSFRHQLDNDQMTYLDAGIPSGATAAGTLNAAITAGTAGYSKLATINGGGTTIGTMWTVPDLSWLDADNVPGYIGLGASGQIYAFSPSTPYFNTSQVTNFPEAISWQQLGRASLYGENFVPNEEFFIDHKEFKNEIALMLAPGVTLTAGNRIETREGFEQSIGMSKCTSCHITGQGREVDERTSDVNIGLAGKFGQVTVNYDYLKREFRENAADPTRTYDPALPPNPNALYTTGNSTFDNRLLYDYEAGELPYDTTPDSDKNSHVLKARVDMAGNSSLIGSYVHSKVESLKTDAAGYDVADNLLRTSYDAYGLKAATKLGDKIKLTARVRLEEKQSNDNSILFTPLNPASATSLGAAPGSTTVVLDSLEDRDVLTFGVDGVYRLARYTTVRLGYEQEVVERDNEEFDETTTQTFKARANTRLGRSLNARVGYTYRNIDSPLHNPDAAEYLDPVTGLPYYDKDGLTAGWQPGYAIGNGPTYGSDYYELRATDLSNLPEDVHEAKVTLTWSPSAIFAATANLRMKLEDNELDRSTWEQDTVNSGVSFWYAPSEQLNFTFAYNWLGQSTESKFCQGWYDG